MNVHAGTPRRTSGLAWLAIILAVVSLVLLTQGRPVPWPFWILPFLSLIGAGPMAFGIDRSHPRLTQGLALVTIVGALVVSVGVVMLRWHR